MPLAGRRYNDERPPRAAEGSAPAAEQPQLGGRQGIAVGALIVPQALVQTVRAALTCKAWLKSGRNICKYTRPAAQVICPPLRAVP